MMYTFFVLLVITLNCGALPTQPEHVNTDKRSEHDCLVHGYRFRHGEIFTIPGYSHCLRYRCLGGGWDIYEEACEVAGQCHNVGSVFTSDCVTYTCEKTDNWYQPRRVRSMCKDANGVCRGEYETFPYVINGHRFNRCQCIVSANGYVRYSCGSK